LGESTFPGRYGCAIDQAGSYIANRKCTLKRQISGGLQKEPRSAAREARFRSKNEHVPMECVHHLEYVIEAIKGESPLAVSRLLLCLRLRFLSRNHLDPWVPRPCLPASVHYKKRILQAWFHMMFSSQLVIMGFSLGFPDSLARYCMQSGRKLIRYTYIKKKM
jgi:hypothetical protein